MRGSNLIWTIVGVLLIIALLIFILGRRASRPRERRAGPRSKSVPGPRRHPRGQVGEADRRTATVVRGRPDEVGVVDHLDPLPRRAQRARQRGALAVGVLHDEHPARAAAAPRRGPPPRSGTASPSADPP